MYSDQQLLNALRNWRMVYKLEVLT